MPDDYLHKRNASVLDGLGHVLVGLSASNKEQLLSAGYRTFRGRSSEAQSICRRLAQLNPEIARLFKPRQETLSHLNLRMVLANPRNAPFEAAPVSSFIAVSYAWHYPDWQLPAAATPITPGWDISKPMADAVMACRENDREGVWIDKLCINQDDEQDKTTHVGAMDMIYRSARRLIILLEDVQLDEDEAFAALLYREWFQDMCTAVTEENPAQNERNDFLMNFMFKKDGEYIQERERLLSADQNSSDTQSCSISFARLVAGRRGLITRILTARWFSRAWCAHESRLKPQEMLYNPLMLCFRPDGTVLSFEYLFIHWLSRYLFDASELAHAASAATQGDTYISPRNNNISQTGLHAAMFATDNRIADHEGFIRLMIDPNPSELAQWQYRTSWMQAESNTNSCALQHLQNILPHKCRFMGDMISIALNTSNIPLVFTGEVDTAQEAVRIFSVLVLASNDVTPLLASRAWHRLSECETSWPTPGTVSTLPDALYLPDSSVIHSVTREYIELDLLAFRTIPMEPSSSALAKAAALIRKFNLVSVAREYTAISNSNVQLLSATRAISVDMIKRGKVKPMDVFVKTWLAHGIDCGFAWMAGFPDTMQQATTERFLYGVIDNAPDDRLNPAARTLLAMTRGPENTEPDIELGNGVQSLARFLRTILDPRLKYFPAQPRRLALNLTDHAIVSQTTNVGYIAVPLALAHVPAQYQRAWVLEPFDPVAEQQRPERVQDYLPHPARTQIAPGEEVEDVYPLLTSDFKDRRTPMNDGGTWKLRSRSEIIGCQGFEPIISRLAAGNIENDASMMLLRKQKVYDAREYDWKAVFQATKTLGGIPDAHKDAGGWTGFFKRLFQIDVWG